MVDVLPELRAECDLADDAVTGHDREHGENDQRHGHGRRAVVSVLCGVATRLAEEDDHEQTRHVKRREERGKQREQEDEFVRLPGRGEDRVF